MTANQHGPAAGAPLPTLELARTPGHLIRRAQRVHGVLWARYVGPETTSPQFAVLSTVAGRPGLDQTTVGTLASLDKSTTVDIVRRLVRHGWITAGPDPEDRRRKVLDLSRPARAALQTLTSRAALVQQALLAPLDPRRAQAFVRDLATLAYEGAYERTAVDDARPIELGLELSTTPGHLIRRAQQAYTVRWTQRFHGTLTGPQYAVLCALAQQEPSDQARLGEAASLDKSSTAEVVERLASRDLITVITDVSDRRRKKLLLSPGARKALPGLTATAAEVQAELMDLLPAEARSAFLASLASVAYAEITEDAAPSDAGSDRTAPRA
ncbi:MarR family winged helix-turn-helix transcriptional regulator [Pseudonocardia sp. WMMC193]|uniref:MarR family winged helix-turn-helix transcriptional regulator n=1 Tax=Pseudonocardia sp. WMMC193 TaxID=2911965 RepID=UPI001F013348|nr:MarR family transcriptional regulator [Pseudonocardia sp. WMMC193]MCF7547471.1 MarR family transcriptional regulator [Pseudonocardia sp. WMMC193]